MNRRTALGLVVVGLATLLSTSMGGAAAQTEERDETAAAIVTMMVEPGVERVIEDGAGHSLQQKHPDHPRDIDHIAVAPDGTVWVASTARMSDNRFLDGFQVWPIGKPGLYGREEGVPEGIGFLAFMPDGALWAIGSEIATFDGEAWSGNQGGHRAVSPDGTLWLLSPNGGLESWDGQAFTPYLQDRWLNGVSVGDDGTVWAFGPDTLASFDGQEWTVTDVSSQGFTSPDGATWRAGGNGVERVLGGERTRYLKGLNINGIALAPDGTVWVAAERDEGRDRGGLYRIAP